MRQSQPEQHRMVAKTEPEQLRVVAKAEPEACVYADRQRTSSFTKFRNDARRSIPEGDSHPRHIPECESGPRTLRLLPEGRFGNVQVGSVSSNNNHFCRIGFSSPRPRRSIRAPSPPIGSHRPCAGPSRIVRRPLLASDPTPATGSLGPPGHPGAGFGPWRASPHNPAALGGVWPRGSVGRPLPDRATVVGSAASGLGGRTFYIRQRIQSSPEWQFVFIASFLFPIRTLSSRFGLTRRARA